jgi:hypothetical protein
LINGGGAIYLQIENQVVESGFTILVNNGGEIVYLISKGAYYFGNQVRTWLLKGK